MASHEERERYSRPDPEFEALLTKIGPLPAPGSSALSDLTNARAMLASRKRAQNAAHAPPCLMSPAVVRTEELHIPVRGDGKAVLARLYRSVKERKTAVGTGFVNGSISNDDAVVNGNEKERGSALVMMLHGGGFCLGDVENEDVLCRRFADRWRVIVVNVCYRLAPERRFPGAVEDAWDALVWLAENAPHLGADLSRGFLVSGVSAGGNLTDVLGHLARDRSLSPPLTGLLEIVPLLCQYEVCPEKWQQYYTSHIQNRESPIMPQSTLDWLLEQYRPDPGSQLFSTLNWAGGHEGLPPVFIVVCGTDVLRDEGLIYERVLREEAAVRTKLLVCPGLPHAFWTAVPELPASRKVMDDMVDAIGWLLGEHEVEGVNGHIDRSPA